MDYWNNKINVSKEAAEMQVSIISKFPPKKKLKIALDFGNMGVDRTREWIQESNPNYSELEINLEWVRQMYYEQGEMSEEYWQFYKKTMESKIKKDWAKRFRRMLKERDWTYEDIAKMGNFKNGKVIEATISRGLPSFAKLAIVIYEKLK